MIASVDLAGYIVIDLSERLSQYEVLGSLVWRRK
jgi:hypothetical protein